MKIDDFEIDKVRKIADIRDFIPGLSGRGATQYTKCPNCGKEGKGKGLCVTHKPGKDLAKCFSCDFSLNGAISAEMYYSGSDFVEAAKAVASKYGIFLETVRTQKPASAGKTAATFCERQLADSGLTIDDITAEVRVEGKDGDYFVQTFRRGGMDKFFNPNNTDDEMLIFYYDLWGKQVQYATRGAAGHLRPYIRIRWSNPALHLDRDGREIKYQSPKGAPTKFYIPQYIRTRFLKKEHIETLIIQEGEKKAEKACKHGIPSIGIQGIYNIGNAETGLIQDLQYLVQQCSIRNVVLLMDSDWDNLHKNLQDRDNVDQRPNQFAKAVTKFKQYIQTMHNVGVSVDVYFGHINVNDKGDKGIDDLLVNTLKGHESDLAKEVDTVLHTHDGKGKYLDIHKISTKTEFQIMDYWALNDREAFFTRHRDELKELGSFKFSRILYRVENGEFVQSSKFNGDKDFWVVGYNDKGKKTVDFDYIEALHFITANGFYRIHTSDLDVDLYKFIKIEDGVVSYSGPSEIRDFVYYYAIHACRDKDVNMMLASRLGTLLGPDKLERLSKIDDSFDIFAPDVQRLYFRNGQVQITSRGIEFGDILGQVWNTKVIKRKFKRVPIIDDISYDSEAGFKIQTSEHAEKCEFLQFLHNTSNFWHNAGEGEITEQDVKDFLLHLVNKITCIGFLLVDYKYKTEQKAVIAMDGQLGEVSQSNGRTGKSLIGNAISKMLSQTYIDGRNTKNDDDFLYSNVTLRTRNIFLDDVKVNFDFEKFFGALTGDLAVNPKAMARFVIPNERSPKFYITTNHAINATGSSAMDRISFMAFSDYYNDTHSPIDDFGHAFFDDWDEEQWNLFDNLMAECIMYYFKSMANGWYRTGKGAVPPPMHDIKMRTLRQQMGEAFVQWADVYFDETGVNINNRIIRKTMYDAFLSQYPDARSFVTPTNFKKKVILYCQYKDWHFNISKPNKSGANYTDWQNTNAIGSFIGEADKSGGTEFFTVTSPEFAKKQPF